MARFSCYLTEAAWLWGLAAVAVVVASGVHYILASGDRRTLRKSATKQGLQQEPEDFGETYLDKI